MKTVFGKWLLYLGLMLILLGGFIFVGMHLNLFGHIPGDFVYRDHNHIVIFPLASCVIFSLVVSAIFYLVKRNKR
jgi:hypothetical protein